MAGHSAAWNTSSKIPDSTPASTQQAVTDYVRAGVAADKIVVGMPLYGRSFTNTDGPGTAYSGIGPGIWQAGLYDYKNISRPDAVIQQDSSALAAWSYDSAQRLMISYDTPAVVSLKAEQIMSQNLGGAMWWEVSSDELGSESLISTVSLSLFRDRYPSSVPPSFPSFSRHSSVSCPSHSILSIRSLLRLVVH